MKGDRRTPLAAHLSPHTSRHTPLATHLVPNPLLEPHNRETPFRAPPRRHLATNTTVVPRSQTPFGNARPRNSVSSPATTPSFRHPRVSSPVRDHLDEPAL